VVRVFSFSLSLSLLVSCLLVRPVQSAPAQTFLAGRAPGGVMCAPRAHIWHVWCGVVGCRSRDEIRLPGFGRSSTWRHAATASSAMARGPAPPPGSWRSCSSSQRTRWRRSRTSSASCTVGRCLHPPCPDEWVVGSITHRRPAPTPARGMDEAWMRHGGVTPLCGLSPPPPPPPPPLSVSVQPSSHALPATHSGCRTLSPRAASATFSRSPRSGPRCALLPPASTAHGVGWEVPMQRSFLVLGVEPRH
jgi:hypothetical protein